MRHHTVSRRHAGSSSPHSGTEEVLDGPSSDRIEAMVGKMQGRSPRALGRKSQQLSHQVAETLQEVLADCGDPVLQSLRVLAVEPAPDASRLQVTLAIEPLLPEEQVKLARIHEHLARASGYLRSEVSSAITRKRAPVLVYRLSALES